MPSITAGLDMQMHKFDQPVINLHELTNGLMSYYSTDFNRELLGKSRSRLGYHQTLPEVVDLLKSVDHYKTARLAQYHIKQRQDSLADQLPFYDYLNKNFFIISCRRENLFEHAVSQTLNKITKKLNVYSPGEKVSVFLDIYKNRVTLDLYTFKDTLDIYENYLSWCSNHFDI
jgi:hypothetical protein